MKFYFEGNTREATEAESVHLIRKGWIECVEEIPIIDETKESVVAKAWAVIGGKAIRQYEITNLSVEQKKEKAFNDAIKLGFDTGLGYRLALNSDDRAAFNQMATLLREGEELGVFLPDNPIPIKDIEGVKHTVTVAQFRQIVVGYGVHFAGIWESK